MLTVTIPSIQLFNEQDDSFVNTKETTIKIIHSLISISKWESIWKEPFLTNKKRSREQQISYIKCMTVSTGLDFDIYETIPNSTLTQINTYIEDSMTATTFNKTELSSSKRSPIITSELIYYWMVAMNIPFECEKWHLNRLLTLINICDLKNGPKKKMTKSEAMMQQSSLNAKRKAELKTRG